MSEKHKMSLVKRVAFISAGLAVISLIVFFVFNPKFLFVVVWKTAEFADSLYANLIYRTDSFPVKVGLSGKAFDYEIKINEVMECKTGYSTKWDENGGGGEYTYMPHPYLFQFNNDKSIVIAKISSSACSKKAKTSRIEKLYWLSSNEKPEQVIISNAEDELKKLELKHNLLTQKTKTTQRYKFTWKAYLEESDIKSSELLDKYYHYFANTVTIYDKEAWLQKLYLKQAIKNTNKPIKIDLSSENIKDLKKLFPKKSYRIVKNSASELGLDLNSSYGYFKSIYNLESNEVSDDIMTNNYKNLSNKYALNLFGNKIALGTKDILCYAGANEYGNVYNVYFLPNEEKVILFSSCFYIRSFPTTPILEEIK